MKILAVPPAGKCGVIVGQGGRYGQVGRALAIPTHPRPQPPMLQRNSLATEAAAWRKLTQAQRDVWTAAPQQFNSKASVGQKGTLTGCQLFCKINVATDQRGEPHYRQRRRERPARPPRLRHPAD